MRVGNGKHGTSARRVSPIVGGVGSLVLHAALYLTLSWATTLPSLGIELELPTEVEFGVTEATVSTTPPRSAPVVEQAPAPPSESGSDEAPTQAPAAIDAGAPPDAGRDAGADAGIDAGIDAAVDAGRDAGSSRNAGRPVDAATGAAADAARDAEAAEPARDAGQPLLSAYAPEGAQLALRLHMGLVRSSPLASEVRALLDAIPDWKLVVDGSGIDPLRDLERVYLASPNLQRSRLVIAGQYAGDDDLPRRAVASLARARGVEASWTVHDGIAVAPWANADTTERIVALIAPKQFTITRREDLPRVLAVAEQLARRRAPDGGLPPAEALLALGEGVTLAATVDGVHAFARGRTRGLPERIEAAVRQTEAGPIVLHARGHFESAHAARIAMDFWKHQRDAYAGHPLVAFVGMARPLERAVFQLEDAQLTFETSVTLQQARVLLGFLRDALSPPPAGAAHTPTPAQSPAR